MAGQQRWPQRLGWFVLIWALSVAAVGAAAWLIRLVLLSDCRTSDSTGVVK